MDILQEMKDYRDRIDQAIQVLESTSTSRFSLGKTITVRSNKRRHLSPASRRKIALAAKKRWAAAKKAGRNRL